MKHLLIIALVLMALNSNATNYRVHAETNNLYGQDYAIELIVDISKYGTYSNVNAVYFWDGEEYVKMDYVSDVINNRYWVNIKGNIFYFKV